MIILTIRTDTPEAEIGLFEDSKKIAYKTWQAHRQLAETIHKQILDLLKAHKQDWPDVGGIVCFKGPGSFTGLRIGITVSNTLSYGLNIPIVGQTGEKWIELGVQRLKTGENDAQVLPEYGAPAFVTAPKK